METYIQAFDNYEQDNWARLLPMAEYANNNAKNARTGHISFELNCGYHPRISYEEADPRSQLKSADRLANKLKNLMTVYKDKFLHA